jgi:hypothetical protein
MSKKSYETIQYPLSHLDDIPYYSRGFSLYTENPNPSRWNQQYVIFGTYDPNKRVIFVDVRYDTHLLHIKQKAEKKG